MSIVIDFKVHLGPSWGRLWGHFSDFPVIWDAKGGDSFQVHVFGDAGMEMMPECNGFMFVMNMLKHVDH
jgi:hypothetical protein